MKDKDKNMLILGVFIIIVLIIIVVAVLIHKNKEKWSEPQVVRFVNNSSKVCRFYYYLYPSEDKVPKNRVPSLIYNANTGKVDDDEYIAAVEDLKPGETITKDYFAGIPIGHPIIFQIRNPRTPQLLNTYNATKEEETTNPYISYRVISEDNPLALDPKNDPSVYIRVERFQF